MTRRGISRAALVIAAGFLIFTSAPGSAAPTAGTDKAEAAGKPEALTKAKKSRTHKASRSRKAKAAALKAKQKAAALKSAKAKAAAIAQASETELPDAVANARAQMSVPDTRGSATISGASPLESATADQQDELTRSLATPLADEPRKISTQLVVNDQPQSGLPIIAPEPPRPAAKAPAPSPTASASSADAWAQSSLIGKIFIAFGGMLTLASAARMLIA